MGNRYSFGFRQRHAVHSHQQRPPEKVAAGIDETRNLIQAQDGREPFRFFRIREKIPKLRPSKCADEEESQRRHMVDHGAYR